MRLLAKQKIYAVKNGKTPGIYLTWDACKEQVQGYKGAQYKSFSTMDDATDYLGLKQKADVPSNFDATKSIRMDTKENSKSYYAVRVGRTPGIYGSWSECEMQVKGFPKAEYQKCKTWTDALDYMDGHAVKMKEDNALKSDKMSLTQLKEPYAFVDGSFNPSTKCYGFGVFIQANGQTYPMVGSSLDNDDSGKSRMRNVAGEIDGAMAAVKKAEKLGLSELKMYYDYAGIEHWATDWSANNEYTKAYKAFMQSPDRTCKISFEHVKGHTGIEGNEIVDAMAKYAVGIDLNQKQQKLFDKVYAGKKDENLRKKRLKLLDDELSDSVDMQFGE